MVFGNALTGLDALAICDLGPKKDAVEISKLLDNSFTLKDLSLAH